MYSEGQTVYCVAGGAVSALSFWQTHVHALLMQRDIILGLWGKNLSRTFVALSFQSLEVSVKNAPLFLLQFCQPVIKPKSILT